MTTAPPPIPTITASQTRGKPFAITGLVIAVIGVLPLLIYFFNCIKQLGTRNSFYGNTGNPLSIIAMGFIGFVIHAIGLVCGIVGFSTGAKKFALFGLIGNGIILASVLLFGFVGIAGA